MELKETSLNTSTHKAMLVLHKLVEAQETGNYKLFCECFWQHKGLINIGTDVDEYWTGWESFDAYMHKIIASRNGFKIYTRETKINLSADENVAWYSQLMDTCIETKGEPVRIEGFRHTGVLQKINKEWKIVQSHISVPYYSED